MNMILFCCMSCQKLGRSTVRSQFVTENSQDYAITITAVHYTFFQSPWQKNEETKPRTATD